MLPKLLLKTWDHLVCLMETWLLIRLWIILFLVILVMIFSEDLTSVISTTIKQFFLIPYTIQEQSL